MNSVLKVLLISSAASLAAFSTAQAAKPKGTAVQTKPVQTKNDITQALIVACSIHTALKDIEILGLSFVPGAANVPAIVSALCAVLNTQLASTSKGLAAAPANLPVKLKASVPVVDPATGKAETVTVRIKGVFNPIK